MNKMIMISQIEYTLLEAAGGLDVDVRYIVYKVPGFREPQPELVQAVIDSYKEESCLKD